MLVWQKENCSIARKVALAGDFLPSGELTLSPGHSWGDMAGWVAPYFADVDVAIVNLECPLGAMGLAPKPKIGLGANFTGCEGALEYLEPLGIGFVGLANNHIYDFGDEGVARTAQAASRNKVAAIGVTRKLSEAPDVAVWRGPEKTSVGFWAAARGLDDCASLNRTGVEPATLKRGLAALEEIERRGARLKIALLHLGLEHTNRPDPDDVLLMRSLSKAGFDAVAAAHSHRISGWDSVARPGRPAGFCFYGLGSLASSVIYSPLEREGLVVVLGLDREGEIAQIDVRPLYLRDAGWGAVPDRPTAERIEQRFLDLSNEIASDTFKLHFYKDVGQGFFRRQMRDFRAAIQNGGLRGAAQKMSRIRARHLKRMVRAAFN
jgi:poly-gamma-glutamate capsule biosynthesis protein CapA/YwtB (metallophosphatase superfamily)